jgi:hypothetical protein
MSLMRKGTSLTTLGANRANAQKSTGPVSARGKQASRKNAVKHWGRAEVLRPLMPALGEKPEEFEAFLESLRQTLAPRDAFEDLLVSDMAEAHWHLRRLIRGEAGARADSRRHRQALDDAAAARLEAGQLNDLEPIVAGTVGLVGLKDSPPKFQQIIEFLQQIDEEVQQKGFQDEGPSLLKCLYGKNPGYRGLRLITAYEVCLGEQQPAATGEEQADDVEGEDGGATYEETADGNAIDAAGSKGSIDYRAEFHKLIADEIDWCEERAARDRQARAELRAPRIEGALEIDHKSRLSLMNQDRLERGFERKWKLLLRYRESRTAEPGC